MNTTNRFSEEQRILTTSDFLRAMGQPGRLKIIALLSIKEACVCHMEATLGYRQAYLSQQLTVLRDAGIVTARREGKHSYYSLVHLETIGIVKTVGALLGFDDTWIEDLNRLQSACDCPHCRPQPLSDTEENTVEHRSYPN